MTESLTTLFIYGTLRSGCRAHHLMRGAEYTGEAKLKGHLLYIDRYPGLILDPTSEVSGELYSVTDDHLAELDDYEGCYAEPPEYERQRVDVITHENQRLSVSSYVFVNGKPEHQRMDHMDWKVFIEENPDLNHFA